MFIIESMAPIYRSIRNLLLELPLNDAESTGLAASHRQALPNNSAKIQSGETPI